MNKLILLCLATVAVFATVGCKTAWKWQTFDVDISIPVPLPIPYIPDDSEVNGFEAPHRIYGATETQPYEINWTERQSAEIRFTDHPANRIMAADKEDK